MVQIKTDSFNQIPYFNGQLLSGFEFPLFPFFDGSDWHIWFPKGDGTLLNIKGIPVDSCYFSSAPHSLDDAHINFLSLFYTRFNFTDKSFLVGGIEADLRNLAVIFEKLDILLECHRKSPRLDIGLSRMVSMEIKYCAMVIRSIFDLTQEILQNLWGKLELVGGGKPRLLKERYSQMVLHENKPITKTMIISKFGISENLASWYLNSQSFFLSLRSLRDQIVHSGKEIRYIFCDKDDFLLAIDSNNLFKMCIWTDGNTKPNGLGSVRTFIATMIITTIHHLDILGKIITDEITVPISCVKDVNLYVKGTHISNLNKLSSIINKPW